MKVVIDTNRIIASLIKEGVSRAILFSKKFNFITPDFSLEEITKYKKEIMDKARISEEEFRLLLVLLFEKITIIPKEEYSPFMAEARLLISDTNDVPFIALALNSKTDGIWSDDSDFLKQNKIRIFSTKEMIELCNF